MDHKNNELERLQPINSFTFFMSITSIAYFIVLRWTARDKINGLNKSFINYNLISFLTHF